MKLSAYILSICTFIGCTAAHAISNQEKIGFINELHTVPFRGYQNKPFSQGSEYVFVEFKGSPNRAVFTLLRENGGYKNRRFGGRSIETSNTSKREPIDCMNGNLIAIDYDTQKPRPLHNSETKAPLKCYLNDQAKIKLYDFFQKGGKANNIGRGFEKRDAKDVFVQDAGRLFHPAQDEMIEQRFGRNQ